MNANKNLFHQNLWQIEPFSDVTLVDEDTEKVFKTCHFEVSLLCTPKGLGSEFSTELQLPKMRGISDMIIFGLTS